MLIKTESGGTTEAPPAPPWLLLEALHLGALPGFVWKGRRARWVLEKLSSHHSPSESSTKPESPT